MLVGGRLLTLDGLSSTQIVDEYLIYTPLALAPGETFRMEWRVASTPYLRSLILRSAFRRGPSVASSSITQRTTL